MRKDVPIVSSDFSEPPQHPATPFRRARSRVFYASDALATSSTLNLTSDGSCRRSGKRERGSFTPRPVSVITETSECLINTADEDSSGKSSSPESSPAGSWREFVCTPNSNWRCSPSQRSQDSGYSDSGDSSTGVHTDGAENPGSAQVKHITRVYFGDCRPLGDQCSSCSQLTLNSKSNNLNSNRVFKTARRRCYSSVNVAYTSDNDGELHNNDKQSNQSLIKSPDSNRQTLVLDELEVNLEHKSLPSSTPNSSSKKRISKQYLKSLFNEQRTLKDKKNSDSKSILRLPSFTPKKTSSTERLLDSCPPPNRQAPHKARRRWSVSGTNENALTISKGLFNLGSSLDDLEETPKTPKDLLDQVSKSFSLIRLDENVEDESSAKDSQENSTARLLIPTTHLKNSSLTQWLDELLGRCEPECMNTLQSKSLLVQDSNTSIVQPENSISNVQKKAHVVSTEFALLCQKIENLQLKDVQPLVASLVEYIKGFIGSQCPSSQLKGEDAYMSSLDHQVRVVDQICKRLVEVCKELLSDPDRFWIPNDEPQSDDRSRSTDCKLLRDFVKIVTALGHAFTKLVDMLLSRGIRVMVNILEDSASEKELRFAVMHITSLGVDGGHVCRLVGRAGGIRALLGICVDPGRRKIRPHALRALATVCCVAEGIAYFEKDGGLDVIAEVLCDPESVEEERSEAAGVLAQITSPWVEDNPQLPCLDGHLEPLVSALTEMAKTTTSMEALLLSTAALANLTFLDGNCTDIFLKNATHKVLLKKVQSHPNLTIFIKDQIATVLANLSSGNSAAKEVVEENGISILVNFLNTEQPENGHLPEVAATERVQQKTAIAISRLSTDQSVAERILQLGGARRLVILCKEEKERNFSDAVLVACLAALRKIAAACGYEELRGVDASELIEPRLLDSFLIYSSQQESYV